MAAAGPCRRLSVEKRELFRPDGAACTPTASEFAVLPVLVAAQGKMLTGAARRLDPW